MNDLVLRGVTYDKRSADSRGSHTATSASHSSEAGGPMMNAALLVAPANFVEPKLELAQLWSSLQASWIAFLMLWLFAT